MIHQAKAEPAAAPVLIQVERGEELQAGEVIASPGTGVAGVMDNNLRDVIQRTPLRPRPLVIVRQQPADVDQVQRSGVCCWGFAHGVPPAIRAMMISRV